MTETPARVVLQQILAPDVIVRISFFGAGEINEEVLTNLKANIDLMITALTPDPPNSPPATIEQPPTFKQQWDSIEPKS